MASLASQNVEEIVEIGIILRQSQVDVLNRMLTARNDAEKLWAKKEKKRPRYHTMKSLIEEKIDVWIADHRKMERLKNAPPEKTERKPMKPGGKETRRFFD